MTVSRPSPPRPAEPSHPGPAAGALPSRPVIFEARTPARICDLGGWTDTWFGGPGRVLNVAVAGAVSATVEVAARNGEAAEGVGVAVRLPDLAEEFVVHPGVARAPGSRHRLIEAAIDAFPPPAGQAGSLTVRSALPPGCGAGTSASVAVAVVGALTAARGAPLTGREAAYEAHRLEATVVGAETGIQDQICAAWGGINFITVDRFPAAVVEQLPEWPELDGLLTLVYLGRAHDSPSVHRQVIAAAAAGGRTAASLAALRQAADLGRAAVVDRDPAALGVAMVANTAAQTELHEALVGSDARRVMALAADHRAAGWKVNGAGGDGGSLTVLSLSPHDRVAFEAAVCELSAGYRVIPVRTGGPGLVVGRRA